MHNEHSSLTMRIELDDLSRPAVHALLNEHLANMYELSSAGKVFALDLACRSPAACRGLCTTPHRRWPARHVMLVARINAKE
jgi:hypothetical protein